MSRVIKVGDLVKYTDKYPRLKNHRFIVTHFIDNKSNDFIEVHGIDKGSGFETFDYINTLVPCNEELAIKNFNKDLKELLK